MFFAQSPAWRECFNVVLAVFWHVVLQNYAKLVLKQQQLGFLKQKHMDLVNKTGMIFLTNTLQVIESIYIYII